MDRPKEFDFNLISYIPPVAFLFTGLAIRGRTEISWLSTGLIILAVLIYVMMILRHRKVTISENEIVIFFLLGREDHIPKEEVESYQRKSVFHKVESVDWTFRMKSGKKIHLNNSLLKKEESFIATVDGFCVGLEKEGD